MKRSSKKHILKFIFFFPLIFFIIGRPPEFGRDTDFFRGFAIPKPAIRVGLGVGLTDIVIRSSSGMKIFKVQGDYELLAEDIAEAQIKGHKEKLSEKFVIQVARARTREEAEKTGRDLQPKVEAQVSVTQDAGSGLPGLWHVTIGDFLTRGDALHYLAKLTRLGLKDVWITREEITEADSKPFGLLLDGKFLGLDEETVLYFVPANTESYLSFNDRAYRGILTVRHTPRGVALINLVNLDEYLQGVVPCELSPYEYGEIEAQKAQAIAARTYALKNMGKHGGLGYDLDDSPADQVYKGLSSEGVLSTRAVRETKGEVALYRKALIDALYTSTCGGMTENVENVFQGAAMPYLRGVECTAEQQEEWVLKTAIGLKPMTWGGRDIGSKLASMMVLNVIPYTNDPDFFRQPAGIEESLAWVRNLLAALGRKGDVPEAAAEPLTHARLAVMMVNALEWQDRVKNLLLKSEADFVLRDFPEIKGEERNALAYMIVSGIFPAPVKESGQERPVSRAELGFILYKAYALHRPPFEAGLLRRVEKGRLEIVQNGEPRTLGLSENALFLRDLDGTSSFTRRHVLVGGEQVRFLERDGEVMLLEVLYGSPSNILDRPSVYHRWQVRMSREDIERRVNQFYPVGRLIDLIPRERGASKRVTELEVIGSESQVVVSGLKIRWVLGLRETYFVVDKETDESGSATHFTFSGKGWGHGVGLCQVGAYRLAQVGAGYKDILKKYYQGITIDKVY